MKCHMCHRPGGHVFTDAGRQRLMCEGCYESAIRERSERDARNVRALELHAKACVREVEEAERAVGLASMRLDVARRNQDAATTAVAQARGWLR